MKSRHRPPLNLSDPEPNAADALGVGEGEGEGEGLTDAVDSGEALAEPEAEHVTPERPTPERPMSERRRRRLLEEQRQAEARAAAQAEAAHAPMAVASSHQTPVVTPQFAESADAPPAAVEAPRVPKGKSRRAPAPAEPGRMAYPLATAAAVLWIGGVASWAAYELGSGGSALDPLRLALYLLIAFAPAGLALLLAHAIRQGAGLAAETKRARGLAEALVAPTALAAQQTGQVLLTLRNDIDQAALATENARNEMTLLRQVLTEETGRLNEAAEAAGRTARRLAEQLGRERESMQTLGLHLDTQSSGVLDAVERQSRMVMDASDLAQTQLREAEAALAARAADLAAAANEAQDAARLAADDLARQTLRLENTGAGVAEQIQSVEEGLGQQRAALVTAAYALRTDQEDFSAQVESQRAQLTEQLDAARNASGDLGETSSRTAASMRELVEAATDQFRALIDMSQREADGFDAATKLALDRFEAVAAEARDTLTEETRHTLAMLKAAADESRAAAADASTQAQVRVDRLGEALFDAAQKADTAADARVEGARRIVGETADMVDEAGERAIQRLEVTLQRMTQALGQVDTAIGELDQRAARLPEEARQRADEVRKTVEDGLAALTAASRKAAQDTEALDAGFQERVRRNYDMLTEAVRLMGVVSGDGQATRRREAVEAPAVTAPAPTPAPAPERPRAEASDQGLRGRLRLEPAERPAPPPVREPVAPVRETQPREVFARDTLDWNDLAEDGDNEPPLNLDQPIMPSDAQALSDRITASIRRMGVDPNALLPRSRVEEAATAFAERDPDRARQIVRRVAPAAVRSVARRVMNDLDLQSDAERYVRLYAQQMAELGRRNDGVGALTALSNDDGRAFLLLDAAIGDLGG